MKFGTWFILVISTLINNCHDNARTNIKQFFSFSNSDVNFTFGNNFFIAPNPNENNLKNLKINIPNSWGENDSDKLSFYTESMIHDMQFNVTMEIKNYHVVEEKLTNSIVCIFNNIKLVDPFITIYYVEFECNKLDTENYFSSDENGHYFNFSDDENNMNKKVKISNDDYTLLSNSIDLKFGFSYEVINHYDLTSEISNDYVKVKIL